MRIKILPKEITEKIAAGEVVERPASVIKELMENALDAGARRILVTVGSRIVDHLEVTDDGTGMSQDEALLAFQRHATSKVACEADLFHIETLGFRGEALSSIAAVSEMQIETKTEERALGVRVLLAPGKEPFWREQGMTKGTRILVRNLFQTTPARLKFLRAQQTEAGHILDVFIRLALSRTDVSFHLSRGGKRWIDAPAVETLRQRAANLFGWEFAERLLDVEAAEKGERLEGLLGPPDLNRGTQRGIFLFVNRRPVRDIQIQKAIREAYRGELPKGRFPVAILFLGLPFSEVDVNVHPTKLEVHFSEPHRVRDLIVRSLSKALDKKPWIRSERMFEDRVSQPVETRGPRPSGFRQSDPETVRLASSQEGIDAFQVREDARGRWSVGDPRIRDEEAAARVIPESLFSRFRIIGQYQETYLVCEFEDQLLLVDQHAAHERIAYERLQEDLKREGVVQQPFTVPKVVELPPREADCLEGHLESLRGCGLEVSCYGGRSYAIASAPMLIADADPERLLMDIAEELADLARTNRLEALRDHVLARMACHAVVRGGQALDPKEMEALLQAMDNKPGLLRCPHGRPIVIAWSLQEIRKRFHRI